MSSRRRYGPSVDCLCCGAAWVSTEDTRGYPCECTWESHCRHCGKCPVHCTGELPDSVAAIVGAASDYLEAQRNPDSGRANVIEAYDRLVEAVDAKRNDESQVGE